MFKKGFASACYLLPLKKTIFKGPFYKNQLPIFFLVFHSHLTCSEEEPFLKHPNCGLDSLNSQLLMGSVRYALLAFCFLLKFVFFFSFWGTVSKYECQNSPKGSSKFSFLVSLLLVPIFLVCISLDYRMGIIFICHDVIYQEVSVKFK